MNNLKLFLEYIGLYLGMLVLAYLTITNKVPYQATLPAIMTIIVYIAGANVASTITNNKYIKETRWKRAA